VDIFSNVSIALMNELFHDKLQRSLVSKIRPWSNPLIWKDDVLQLQFFCKRSSIYKRCFCINLYSAPRAVLLNSACATEQV